MIKPPYQIINCEISEKVLDNLITLRYITNYTDDGWVQHDHKRWLPLSDILENLFESEKETRVERGSL